MYELFFYDPIKLEELERDTNVKLFSIDGDDRLFIKFADEGRKNVGWLNYNDKWVYGIEGHGVMLSIAFYMYETYHSVFADDLISFVTEDRNEYVDYMLWLFENIDITKEPYKTLYDKIKGEYDNN